MSNSKLFQFMFVGQSIAIATSLHTLVQSHAQSIFSNRGNTLQLPVEFLTVTNQREALKVVRARCPELIFLETGLGNGDRKLFATALRERQPIVRLIEVGCSKTTPPHPFDSFLQTPIEIRQVIGVLQRLVQPNRAHLIPFGNFVLDTANDLLIRPDGTSRLRPMESKLLKYLLENRNSIVKRMDIMRDVWGAESFGDTRMLDVHIRQLRKQIETNPSSPELIITERGFGYTFRI